MSALKFWVWLTEQNRLGGPARQALLEHFGSPEEVYYAESGDLLQVEGITADQAQFVTCKFDYENGIAVYEVEFYFDKAEYDCDVNAKTGAILKFKKEVAGVNVPDPDAAYIGKVKAKEIAFSNAGVKEADAKKVKVEFDYDDGIAKYEVDFHCNKFDYEYEIDALNGNILKVEKDREIEFTDIFFIRWIESFIAALRNFFNK